MVHNLLIVYSLIIPENYLVASPKMPKNCDFLIVCSSDTYNGLLVLLGPFDLVLTLCCAVSVSDVSLCRRQRIPKHQWWLKLRPLLRILAKHDSAYEEEGMYMTVEEGSHDSLVV